MARTLHSLTRKIWLTLSSIKTGVILLILVVIISAAGTVILQRPITEPDDMQRAYSPQMLRILDGLGLTDIFHTWWFLLLLAAVSLCIVAASIERFPNTWRYFSRPYKSADEGFRKVLPNQATISLKDEPSGLAAAERTMREFGLKPEVITRDGRTSLFAERNRLSEMAVYVVHASLLLIFLGGIVDGIFGWRGSLNLTVGQQSNRIELRDHSGRMLPFTIRCDGAGQENYADGTPKKWWSKLTVIEEGGEVSRKEIVVNDPLIYHGVRFYQASYGQTGQISKLILDATPAGGNGQVQTITLANQPVQLDADTSVRIGEFIPDYVVRDGQVYTRSAQVENPAVRLAVESKKTGKTVSFWIPEIPGFAENALSPYQFQPKDLQMVPFTGLEVSHEPGQWAVWAGVLLMALGLGMVFYVVHTRYWVVVVQDARGRLALWIGGAANRNKDAFEEGFRKLVSQVQAELKLQPQPCAPAHEEEQQNVFAGAGLR